MKLSPGSNIATVQETLTMRTFAVRMGGKSHGTYATFQLSFLVSQRTTDFGAIGKILGTGERSLGRLANRASHHGGLCYQNSAMGKSSEETR